MVGDVEGTELGLLVTVSLGAADGLFDAVSVGSADGVALGAEVVGDELGGEVVGDELGTSLGTLLWIT